MTIDELIQSLLDTLRELQDDTTTAPETVAVMQRLLMNRIASLEVLRSIGPAIDEPTKLDPGADRDRRP